MRDEDINNCKLEFDFGQNQDDGEDGEGVDFTGQTPLGPCPKCAGGVYEMGLAYVCENTRRPSRRPATSAAAASSCSRRSCREQMAKLLNEGKTDLLPGFVSQRTRRPFKAFLVRGKDGKISFEFEERKAKPAAKGKDQAEEGDSGAETAAAKPAARKAAATKTAAAKPAAKAPAKTTAARKAPGKRATATKKAVAGE